MEVFDGRMSVFAEKQSEALQRTTETVAQASSGVSGQIDSLLEKVAVTLQSNLDMRKPSAESRPPPRTRPTSRRRWRPL